MIMPGKKIKEITFMGRDESDLVISLEEKKRKTISTRKIRIWFTFIILERLNRVDKAYHV